VRQDFISIPRPRFIAALLAAGLAPLAGARVARADDAVLSVGAIPTDNTANAYYAQDRGYFTRAGLSVTIQDLGSGPAIAAAVSGGTLDVGVSNIATIAAARNRGIALRFIAPASIASPETMTDPIVVPNASTVRAAADLNGKTIAINGLRNLQQITAMAWIDRHGGDSRAVKFIEVPFAEMGAALAANRVDAALPSEPFVASTRNVARRVGNVLDSVAPRFMVLGWFATDGWITAHPDLAASFASAIRDASLWANAHRVETARILVDRAKLDPLIVSAMARSTYGTDLDTSLIEPVVAAAVRYGIIDKAVSANDLIWRARH
jgi:NitT/TauT family transport system substrate-binding protein